MTRVALGIASAVVHAVAIYFLATMVTPWPLADRALVVIWAVGWSVGAWLCSRVHAARPFAALAGAAGILLAVSTTLPTMVAATTLACVAGFVVLPSAVLAYPDGFRRATATVGLPVLVVFGLIGILSASSPGMSWAWQVDVLVATVVVVGAVWWRLERAAAADRDALLWLAVPGGVAMLLVVPLAFVAPGVTRIVLGAVVVLALPAGACVGILRPRAFSIRTVLLRVTSYTIASLVVLAVFTGTVATAQQATGTTPPVGQLGLIAVACAIGFTPLRRVLDGVVERLLLGDPVDPVRAVSRFGDDLSTDPVVALRGLREVLTLPYAALAGPAGIEVSTGTVPADGTYELPLRVGTHVPGTLVIGLRPGELGPADRDRAVLRMIVPALAQAMHARALAADLQDSRERVVTAVEDDRRRLRHDLHDGLGPTLTGVAYAADAARNLVGTDPATAEDLLGALRADTAAAIDEVRRLVDGLRPSALDQLGLLAALRQHSTHLHTAGGQRLEVRLEADELPELTAATEVAVYRIVTEALTNVARHARSPVADVRIAAVRGQLCVDVQDHGPGVDAWTPGVGLASMRERAEQLGGTFAAGGGRVLVEIPVT
ncbi:sensor histidine kinase [Cellulomonas sp. P5_E12]